MCARVALGRVTAKGIKGDEKPEAGGEFSGVPSLCGGALTVMRAPGSALVQPPHPCITPHGPPDSDESCRISPGPAPLSPPWVPTPTDHPAKFTARRGERMATHPGVSSTVEAGRQPAHGWGLQCRVPILENVAALLPSHFPHRVAVPPPQAQAALGPEVGGRELPLPRHLPVARLDSGRSRRLAWPPQPRTSGVPGRTHVKATPAASRQASHLLV